MESVSRAFAAVEERDGLMIGVLPFPETGAESGHPNPWVEIAIRTHLGKQGAEFSSRNHVNVLTSDVVVALPGSAGTASEVALSVRYGRPVVLFGELDRARGLPSAVATARTVEEVIAFVRERLRDGRAGHERSEPGSGPGGQPGGTGPAADRETGSPGADTTTVAP